jgi:hypothetical protein
MNNTLKQLEIESIGSKLYVTGWRGEWDVLMHIKLVGQPPQPCSVGLNPHRAEIKFRDAAREVRDRIQCALARGDVRVYATVRVNAPKKYVAQHPETFPFPNKSVAIVSFRASDFQAQWLPPQSVPAMIRRAQINPTTTNQETNNEADEKAERRRHRGVA